MTKKEPVPDTAPDQDDIAAQLSELADGLKAVANDAIARGFKLKEVEAILGKLQLKDFPDLAESPTIQSFVRMFANAEHMQPGEVRNRGTLAEVIRDWSYGDMEQFPKKTFEPRETIPITWNGLQYQLQDGVEITVPEPIWTEYQRHRRALEQAKIHEDYLLGYSSREPDPNWMADTSARVRAFSQLGPRPDPRTRGIGFLPREGEEESGE